MDKKSTLYLELGQFCGVFLSFRGVKFEREWLKAWQVMAGQGKLHLKANSSTSMNMNVAIDFATRGLKDDGSELGVLFVYVFKNWSGFRALRLSSEQFTSHPHEQEMVLYEGFECYVLGVQEINRGKKQPPVHAVYITDAYGW